MRRAKLPSVAEFSETCMAAIGGLAATVDRIAGVILTWWAIEKSSVERSDRPGDSRGDEEKRERKFYMRSRPLIG